MTQCERIKRHLVTFGSITAVEAMQDYGCMRLAARIADLKGTGMAIKTEIVAGKNRFNEATRYARYVLEG